MSNYNRGNDVAADDYADKAGQDQELEDAVENIVVRKMADQGWLATNIDALMACSDCTDGVTDFARELAGYSTDHRYAQDYFARLNKALRARAYDQAEDEIDG